MFYGTEAFAWLVEIELFNKLWAFDIKAIINWKKNNQIDQLDNLDEQIADETLNKIERIPVELRQFYKGFLNEKYFIAQ